MSIFSATKAGEIFLMSFSRAALTLFASSLKILWIAQLWSSTIFSSALRATSFEREFHDA